MKYFYTSIITAIITTILVLLFFCDCKNERTRNFIQSQHKLDSLNIIIKERNNKIDILSKEVDSIKINKNKISTKIDKSTKKYKKIDSLISILPIDSNCIKKDSLYQKAISLRDCTIINWKQKDSLSEKQLQKKDEIIKEKDNIIVAQEQKENILIKDNKSLSSDLDNEKKKTKKFKKIIKGLTITLITIIPILLIL